SPVPGVPQVSLAVTVWVSPMGATALSGRSSSCVGVSPVHVAAVAPEPLRPTTTAAAGTSRTTVSAVARRARPKPVLILASHLSEPGVLGFPGTSTPREGGLPLLHARRRLD